uniref:Uncharacterized protein n=1 Tax=Caenorhabditis japonica TaxID=281687 RepID=A0A8R1IB75_CAEJA
MEHNDGRMTIEMSLNVMDETRTSVTKGPELSIEERHMSVNQRRNQCEVLQSPQKIRNRLLTTTVITTMTYGCETWTSKESDTKRLQRAVTNMFEIAGCHPPDIEKQVLRRKLKWTGYVSRIKYDRWAQIVSK